MTHKHEPEQADDALIDLQCQGEVEGWLKRHPVMQVGASARWAAWNVSCQRDRSRNGQISTSDGVL